MRSDAPLLFDPRRLDFVSAGLSLIAVLLLIFALKQVAQDGMTWLSALAMVAGLVLGAVFVRRQQILTDPLVDLRLFRIPAFSAALAVTCDEVFVLVEASTAVGAVFEIARMKRR